MPTNSWTNTLADGDSANDLNYSLLHVPISSEDFVANLDSVGVWSATPTCTVKSLTLTDAGGQDTSGITIAAGGFILIHSGAWAGSFAGTATTIDVDGTTYGSFLATSDIVATVHAYFTAGTQLDGGGTGTSITSPDTQITASNLNSGSIIVGAVAISGCTLTTGTINGTPTFTNFCSVGAGVTINGLAIVSNDSAATFAATPTKGIKYLGDGANIQDSYTVDAINTGAVALTNCVPGNIKHNVTIAAVTGDGSIEAAAAAAQLAADYANTTYSINGGAPVAGLLPATSIKNADVQRGIDASGNQTTVTGNLIVPSGGGATQLVFIPV